MKRTQRIISLLLVISLMISGFNYNLGKFIVDRK